MDQPFVDIFPGTEKWKHYRGICKATASDYPAAINCCDALQSRISLWEEKMGYKEKEEDSPASKHYKENGTYQEGLALSWLQTKAESHPGTMLFRPGFYVDKDDPRLGGSPDGILLLNGKYYVVEIKNPQKDIPQETDDIKWRHMVQIMGLMHATGLNDAILFYFRSDSSPVLFHVQFDTELWSLIYGELVKFMHCMEKDMRPMSPAPKILKSILVSGPLVRKVNHVSFFRPV